MKPKLILQLDLLNISPEQGLLKAQNILAKLQKVKNKKTPKYKQAMVLCHVLIDYFRNKH